MTLKKRTVTNEEYEKAYANLDNRKVMRSVTKRYRKRILYDDLQTCAMIALWRALQYHDESYKRKFTGSLFRFTHWECKRELVKNLARARHLPVVLFDIAQEKSENEEGIRHIFECVDLLPDERQKDLVRQRYLQGMSVSAIGKSHGYSKETARERIGQAVSFLKLIANPVGVS